MMLGKLSESVRRLVVGQGDVRSRLRWACEYLFMVQKSMLPAELHERWDSIHSALHRYPAEFGRSSADMTLSRIKNATGSKIAQSVLTLYGELHSYCDAK